MNLGNNLFQARKKCGLSQEEVAEKLGVSRQTISKWETDETLPDIRQAKQMARLYNLSLDELIEFDVDLQEIQAVIAKIDPLHGAKEFLDELRSFSQVILISDTFTQFASPLMKKLGWPTIFCNTLEVADNGEITGFRMRTKDSKLATVKALQSIGFETIASGDSYNDLGIIQASKAVFLFLSTEKIKADNPELPAYEEFDDLMGAIKRAMGIA